MVENPLLTHESKTVNAPWYVRTLTGGVQKNVLIALDRSQSMDVPPKKLPGARRAAIQILDSLAVTDTFFVMSYQHPVQFSAFEFVHTTDSHKESATEWLNNIYAAGGSTTRPDAEFGLGTALVVGSLGVVPEPWRDKITSTVPADERPAQLPAVTDPPDCPFAASQGCEKTVLVMMSDAPLKQGQEDAEKGQWLKAVRTLLDADAAQSQGIYSSSSGDGGSGSTPEPAVLVNVYALKNPFEFFGTPPQGPSLTPYYETLAGKFGGEAMAMDDSQDMMATMSRYWRSLVQGASDASGSRSVVWTWNDVATTEDATGRSELTACRRIDFNTGNNDLQGVMCVEPSAVLPLTLNELQCLPRFLEEMHTRLRSTNCSVENKAKCRAEAVVCAAAGWTPCDCDNTVQLRVQQRTKLREQWWLHRDSSDCRDPFRGNEEGDYCSTGIRTKNHDREAQVKPPPPAIVSDTRPTGCRAEGFGLLLKPRAVAG
ncbi:unnamed protein product [Amoebophrya sp. A120]|nr:unnamed protein product [Amoebophrya sp. A120]|eukprot:GSA120T00003288001.1